MDKNKRKANIILLSLGIDIFICSFSMLIIRNLGKIIALFNEVQFALIFSQLENANKIIPPFIIPFIIIVIFMYLLFKNNNKKMYLKLPCVIVLVIFTQILSIMLTCVNGLYFIDIIISLVNNLGGLGL